MKRFLRFVAMASLGIGVLGNRSSLAVEPAGGPPELTVVDLADQPDASAGDQASTDSNDPPPTPASGQRSWLSRASTQPVQSSNVASPGQSSSFTLGALLIVLGLGGAAIYLRLRRRKREPIPRVESRLSVLSSSRIGPKAYAVTAHVNGRVVLLGVTDHSVTNLGWLDPIDTGVVSAAVPRSPGTGVDESDDVDDLPDDYPGSALRAVSVSPGPLASTKDLKRFQEVLRGAAQHNSDLPMRPSYSATPQSGPSTLSLQTSDVVSAARPASARLTAAPSSRRKRQRRRESLPPEEPSTPSRTSPEPTGEVAMEGQVAGLRALRNG